MTSPGVPVFVVGSGKGGVGQSIVSALFATALAAKGRRVLLLDGEQNLGNLHLLLGIRPAVPLASLLDGERSPADMVQAVGPNLWCVPGESGAESLYALDARDRARLHYRLSALYDDFEVVVVDAGAGLESAVRAAAMRATRFVVVTAPEPTALTGAYALVKSVHFQVPDLPIDMLVNRCLMADDGPQTHVRLAAAAGRLLGRDIRYLGAVPEDPALRTVVGALGPGRLLDAIQATAAGQAVTAIATESLVPSLSS
jgi:flagellar biosynthesis protein FlhG